VTSIDISALLDWTRQHPQWSALAVFVIALAESLAVVGLFVPGAVLIIATGALIGMGLVGFWPILFAAVTGAIVGDGLSFWLGHHYRDRLRGIWPFRNHPQWLARGESYLHRHGGKSILFGRFVGPVRPFVPLVAGMLDMRPRAFYLANILSALVWAPAYLLPGMAFGASLALAGEVALRLVVLLVLLGALTWFVTWSIRRAYLELSPRAGLMTQWLVAWSGRHPGLNRLIGGLLDPSRPEFKTLLVLAALLIGATWLFLGVLEDVVSDDPLVRVDLGIYQLLQDLRTPWGDRIMVFVTELGDGTVIALVAVAVLAWLMWLRKWRIAGYWSAAIVFGQLAAAIFKLAIQRSRPLADYSDGISSYAFPSGHAVMSTVAYGFLAVLIARQLSRPHRWVVYAMAASLIGAIAMSRLYLGVHWMSDVLGGLSLGLVWVSLLGIAYYRHASRISPPKSLAAVALIALVLAGGWHVSDRFSRDLQRYAPRLEFQHLDATMWWQEGWGSLPVYRRDLEGEYEQPFNLQWSGSLASLRETLAARGWIDPVPLNVTTALRWLLPAPDLAELPVLPQVHDGRHEALIMLGPPDNGEQQRDATNAGKKQPVLRLWHSGVVLDPQQDPLWVGYVTLQAQRQILFLRLPVALKEYNKALATLMRSVSIGEQRVVHRLQQGADSEPLWKGKILLMRASAIRGSSASKSETAAPPADP
jgi:membrane protein DedA with SNARE-associated domain/membrane-associated phospholipid phosphatase